MIDAYAYYNRGIARYKLGDKQGAIADFQKAANLYVQQNRLDDYQRSLENIRKIQSFRHRSDRFVG
jgi:tetratricopeptide (TPR) repeat protein